MKKLCLGLSLMLFSIFATANEIRIHAPKVKFWDAMGQRKMPVTSFCLSPDEKTLTTKNAINICDKSRHLGRGYKECANTKREKITLENRFQWRRLVDHRSHEYEYEEYSFGPSVEVSIYSFDPRGGKRFLRHETVELTICE